MIPEIGCNVSNLSQLVPVKTRIPLKTHIIKQYAPVYIQQNPNLNTSQIVCITITNAKDYSPKGDTNSDSHVALGKHCRRQHDETDE